MSVVTVDNRCRSTSSTVVMSYLSPLKINEFDNNESSDPKY